MPVRPSKARGQSVGLQNDLAVFPHKDTSHCHRSMRGRSFNRQIMGKAVWSVLSDLSASVHRPANIMRQLGATETTRASERCLRCSRKFTGHGGKLRYLHGV